MGRVPNDSPSTATENPTRANALLNMIPYFGGPIPGWFRTSWPWTLFFGIQIWKF